ncbi:MAG: hypothetical protein COA32_00435 [Fluviicola sp.]|nr:MAG: hypothetical protein COA32_00435 [Fluviicola sp.]
MKLLFYILLIGYSLISWGQKEVTYLNYDPFFEDTIIHTQTTVKPLLSQSNPETGWNILKKNKNQNSFLRLFPEANIGFGTAKNNVWNNSTRLGIGLGFESKLGTNFYIRGTLVPSYYALNFTGSKTQSILQNTYLFDWNGERSLELQPRIRIGYTPNKYFNFQVGVDQQFIGEGIRSMLLSDYSSPHPFAQLRTKLWKIEFVNLYQFFRENVITKVRQKYASTHMLNLQATRRFQIGIFESVIFEPKDTVLNRGYDIEYLNPFLFYRPTEYSIGSQDRLLIGLNLSYQFDNLMLYGQLAVDDFVLSELVERSRWWANKYSGQFGFKGKIKFNDKQLRYLSEINFSRPFTYTHLSEGTNYGHQGMSLAHPIGANFVESLSEINLIFKNQLSIKAQFMFVQQGGADGDPNTTYGADIYQPYTDRPFEYGYYIGANGKHNRARTSVEITYPIVRKAALIAFVRPAIEMYQYNDNPYQSVFLFYGGLRTSLWNDRSFSF